MASPIPAGLAEYLSESAHEAVALLDPDQLTPDEVAALPQWWPTAASAAGPEAISVATAHWQHVLPSVLDDAVALFTERAVGTALGRVSGNSGGHIVLIYVLRGDARPIVCWFGYPPSAHLDNHTKTFRPGVKADLTQVSEQLRTYYTQVHDRFRIVGWGECGLLPLNELFTLDGAVDEYEYWGDGDHHPEPTQLLPVFTSSNGQLCTELGSEDVWLQDDSILEPMGELWPNIYGWVRRFTEEMARQPG